VHGAGGADANVPLVWPMSNGGTVSREKADVWGLASRFAPVTYQWPH